MALSTKQKQEWLVAQGKPKSYMYFMTGPNLGPDWDWNKAVAGGYSSGELNSFFTSGESAYKAHKTNSKKKGPATPSGPPNVSGVGKNCAATAAKTVAMMVDDAVDIAGQWWNTVGLKASVQEYSSIGPESWIKKLSAIRDDIFDKVGPNSIEAQIVDDLITFMKRVELSKEVAFHSANVITSGNNQFVIKELTQAKNKLDALMAPFDIQKLTTGVFDTIDQFEIENILNDIVSWSRDKALLSYRQAVSSVLGEIADASSEFKAYFNIPPGYYGQGAAIDTDVFDAVQSTLSEFAIWMDGLDDIDTALLALGQLDESATAVSVLVEQWYVQLAVDPSDLPAIKDQTLRLLGPIYDDMKTAVKKNVAAVQESLEAMSNEAFWVNGPNGELVTGSLLEKWTAQYGTDLVGALNEELAKPIGVLTDQLSGLGVFPDPVINSWKTQITDVWNAATDALEEAIESTKFKLPGAVPTKEEALAALEPGYKASILNAGTDELNPLVQQKLEDAGESKTLTYFMTKEQKQDFLLLPKEVFDEVDYSLTWKGQPLAGKGLDTAHYKYAVKNGQQVGSTATVSATSPPKIVTSKIVPPPDPIPVAAVDPVTGAVDKFTIPPGSPSWWADEATDSQLNVLTKEMLKNPSFDAAMKNSGAVKAFEDGQLTKGQASLIIDKLLGSGKPGYKGFGKVWDASEIVDDLAYHQKQTITTAADAVKAAATNAGGEIDASDVAAAVKAVENGPAVSTATTSSAAPIHPNWDEPHTFTYVGDGAKWGGAHRKWHFTDETGSDWMLKHGADFRAEGELAAHRIAHGAGFDIAEARITTQTIGGSKQTGFMQKMYRKSEIRGELADIMPGGSFRGVDDDIIRQVQEHQVLDWLIGNHDGHTQNFLVMRDGRVVGIDKGQAFKFLGKDTLSGDYVPPGNFGEVAYNRMWREFRDGTIDLDLDVIDDVLRRIEAMDEQAYREFLETYARGRFAAGQQAGFLQGTTAKSADEMVELALQRKRTIRKDFTEFYQKMADERGITWSPKWSQATEVPEAAKKTLTKVVKKGDVLTPIDDDLVEALTQRAGTAGKAIYVSGSEIERGQILFDVVTDSQGKQVLRVNAILRPDADKRLRKIIADEGGARVAQAASANAPLPGVPPGVQAASQYSAKAVNGAKTINYHLAQGDGAFNQGTLDIVSNQLQEFQSLKVQLKHITNVEEIADDVITAKITEFQSVGLGGDELEKALVQFIETEASDAAQLKAVQILEPHFQEVVTEGAKGAAASKVGMVPDVDVAGHYEKVKGSALSRMRTQLSSSKVAQHVEVKEPEKVFRSVKASVNRTLSINVGDKSGRIAKLASDTPVPIGGRGMVFEGVTSDGVEMIYRQIDGNYATHQGWLELAIRTDGEVTAADLEKAYRTIRDRFGVAIDLATEEDMELTYWRMVLGTYRNSKEASSVSSKYYKAITDADDRLRQLAQRGKVTKAEEIEAIRGAFKDQFGTVVDSVDYLPIHDHALASHAEEIGWGYFERPELGDMSAELGGKVLYHSTRYGDGDVRFELIGGPTGDALMSQARRQEYGFVSASASASSDLETGGAAGFFTRLGQSTEPGRNYVVMNPARQHRRLGNYNASHDTFGRLTERTQQNYLSPGSYGRYAGHGGNETMVRDQVSWMDDIEIAFFGSQDEATRTVAWIKGQGITHIRGVPVEERFLYHPNPGSYTANFFQTKVGRQGFAERLRRSAEDIVSKAAAKTKQAGAQVAGVASRLKTKVDSVTGLRVTAKKLSAGRSAEVSFSSNVGWKRAAVRYHDTENAVTISMRHLEEASSLSPGASATQIKDWVQSEVGISNWSLADSVEFKWYRGTYLDRGVTLDLSEFGIDLKFIGKYQKPQVIKEFTEAVMNGTLDQFKLKWGVV